MCRSRSIFALAPEVMRLILLLIALVFVTYRGIQDRRAGRRTWRAILLPYAAIGLAIVVTGFIASILFGAGFQW